MFKGKINQSRFNSRRFVSKKKKSHTLTGLFTHTQRSLSANHVAGTQHTWQKAIAEAQTEHQNVF